MLFGLINKITNIIRRVQPDYEYIYPALYILTTHTLDPLRGVYLPIWQFLKVKYWLWLLAICQHAIAPPLLTNHQGRNITIYRPFSFGDLACW